MEISVSESPSFRALGEKFRKVADGSTLRKNLTKTLREAAQPAQQDVQSVVRNLNVKGVKGGGSRRREEIYRQRRPRGRVTSHGLRETISRSIRVKVSYNGRRTGVIIYIDKSLLPYSQRKLPAYMDGQGRWRHPLFGNRKAWYQQSGQPYWRTTLVKHNAEFRKAANEAVQATLKELKS